MTAILLLQIALPTALLLWLWLKPLESRIGLSLQIAATALVLLAVAAIGLWLIVPIWLTFLYALLLAGGAARAVRRPRNRTMPRGAGEWVGSLLLLSLAALALAAFVDAMTGRVPPGGSAIDLAPPLKGPLYFVANGGSSVLVNSHNRTLDRGNARFRPYRGQSQAVDLVQLNWMGRTTTRVRPEDPRRYAIFGDAVYAPCSGRVLVAREDRPDMPVPIPDRSFIPGNHVLLECSPDIHVVLAHFRRGSVAVDAGDWVRTGDFLGEVGNSGNSDEPHLHVHAQRPGTPAEPLGGEPVPIRIGGRYLVRNSLIWAAGE